jgi:hypothetical protein
VLLIVAIVVVLGGIGAVAAYLYRNRPYYEDGPEPYDPTEHEGP